MGQTLPVSFDSQTGLQYNAETGFVSVPTGGTPNVVQSIATAQTSNNHGVFTDPAADSGLLATITPSSLTAKIKVTATIVLINNNVNKNVFATLARNGTNLGAANGFVQLYPGNGFAGGGFFAGMSFSYIDSPGTTSPVNYTVQHRADIGGTSVVGDNSSTLTLIAEEVH